MHSRYTSERVTLRERCCLLIFTAFPNSNLACVECTTGCYKTSENFEMAISEPNVDRIFKRNEFEKLEKLILTKVCGLFRLSDEMKNTLKSFIFEFRWPFLGTYLVIGHMTFSIWKITLVDTIVKKS